MARTRSGRPTATDVEPFKALWEKRKEIGVLADQHGIRGNYDFKWNRQAPDWTSWESIAECFEEYRVALMAKANAGSASRCIQGL